mmetsp:Transcript_28718/g.61851  ORF Transcript_28718/g.61851 Transcript_28718/m.61851 type:complete len:264 (-) Transcript_28718:1700-2491(-)
MSLFPQGPAAAASVPAVVEFRAGKCRLSAQQPNGKYQVVADKSAGKITLTKERDGLMHFKWTNTTSSIVEDDRMVFPGEHVFKRVNTGRPEDRVYLLKYSSGDQRLMFWMQDKAVEKDEEVVKKLNEVLENPNLVVVAPPPAAAGAPGVVNPEEWMQMIGLDPAAMPAPPSSSSASSAPPAPFGTLDVSSILSLMRQTQRRSAPSRTRCRSRTSGPYRGQCRGRGGRCRAPQDPSYDTPADGDGGGAGVSGEGGGNGDAPVDR